MFAHFHKQFLFTATQVRERVEGIIFGHPQMPNLDQFVPTLLSDKDKQCKDEAIIQNRVNV